MTGFMRSGQNSRGISSLPRLLRPVAQASPLVNPMSAGKSRRSKKRRPKRLGLQPLESRRLLSIQPLDLADASLYGTSALLASSRPSISADGQLVVFESSADDLVPNDTDGQPDVFLYNRATSTVSLVSVGPNGQAGGVPDGTFPVISPNGRYVAFESNGSGNILSGVNGDQLYVRDLQTGTTSLVSIGSDGSSAGNSGSASPVFSADSEHLAFLTGSTNLVGGVNFTSGQVNLFERNLVTGTTSLISVAMNGTTDAGVDYGAYFSLSADGRYVAFESSSTNVTPHDVNGNQNVYVRDVVSGTTTLVDIDTTGTSNGDGHNVLPQDTQSISTDGRYVVFESNADNLVAADSNRAENVYVRDLTTGTTTLVSANSDGTGAGGQGAAVSPDGQWVAFVASNALLPQVTNGYANVYLYNIATGKLSLASANAASTNGGNNTSGSTNYPYDFDLGGLVFSADSQQLAFQSSATDLTAGVTTINRNLYERGVATGVTRLVTSDAAGTDGGDNDSHDPVLSADGRYIAFESTADNLVPDDSNGQQDIFVRDMTAGATSLASLHSPLLPLAHPSRQGATLSSITPDGRYVAFSSGVYPGNDGEVNGSDLTLATKFLGGYVPGSFLLDRQTGKIAPISITADGTTADSGYGAKLTPDGNYAVFLSGATTLVKGMSYYGATDEAAVYERNFATGVTNIVSVNPAGTHDVSAGNDAEIVVSDNGRYVAYTSNDPSGVAGATDPNDNYEAVYLRDMQTGVTYLVSHDLANDGQIRGDSNKISISSNGQYVLFTSTDPNLAAGDTNTSQSDVYRWDLTTGLVSLVSVNQAGTGPGDGWSGLYAPPVMTPDGRYIAFVSVASDLTATPTQHQDIFVRDMNSGTTTLVSVNSAGTQSDSDSNDPSISADGSRVAFVSNADNLVPGDTNGYADVFVRDLTAGTTTLVSENAAGTGPGNDSSGPVSQEAPIISADGKYVAFTSVATDLVPDFVPAPGGQNNLYIRDLAAGVTTLASVDQSGTAGADQPIGDPFMFSTASKTVFFDTAADNLVPNDRNNATDPYAFEFFGNSSISGQVFNDANGNGAEDSGEQGLPYWTVYLDANGNAALDTGEQSVVTDATGHYQITDLAPGTYTVAIVPQAGYQQTVPAGAATTYTVTIAADGTSVAGKDFGEVEPLPDLAVQSVSLAATGGVGQPITVSWTVANDGAGPANGSWQDALYLSTKPTLDASAVLLDDVAHNGGLAKGASYTGTDTVDVPALPAGNYYLIVDSDVRNQVFEGDLNANKANNLAASTGTMLVTLPSLDLGTAAQGQFTAAGQDQYYQVNVSAGQTLLVSVASAAAGGEIDLYVRRGDYPTPSDFDFAARTAGDRNPSLSLPDLQAGTYYILVRGDYGPAASAAYTLTASAATFDIQSISPNRGGNTGNVTVAIQATLLSNHTQASLISGQTVVPAASLFYQGGSMLYATFNLNGAPTGFYDLKLTDGTQTKTDAGAFTVEAGGAGAPQILLSAPSTVRVGTGSAVVVSYTNAGNTDVPAPLLMLAAEVVPAVTQDATVAGAAPATDGAATQGALLRLPDQTTYSGNSVQFLGTSGDGPAGILRPGETGQITIPFQAPNTFGVIIQFAVQMADTTQPFDLSAFKGSLRPDNIGADAWNAVFANLTTALGSTVASYVQALDNDASYLSLLGERTADVSRLLGFEVGKANADYAGPTLATSTDASVATPGPALTLTREFLGPIGGRDQMGTLGLGWITNWDISASTDASGNVTVMQQNFDRDFTRQPDGSYQASPNDNGVLTALSGGGYQLRELDGSLTVFNTDGTLDYVQDSNGNRITAAYTNGLLTSLTDSNGAFITLSYNTQGLLTGLQTSDGHQASYAYDASGQHLISYTNEDGTTTYSYLTAQSNPALENALAQIAYSDNTHIYFTYDSQGRLSSTSRDGGQEAIAYSYPAAGGVTTTDSDGASSTALMDDNGLIGETIDPLGNAVFYTRNSQFNITQILAPMGEKWTYSFDTQGDMTSATSPLGETVHYTYNPSGQLSSYQDARGNTTSYTRDGSGNVLDIKYPNGSLEQMSYDPTGDLTELVNARGDAVKYTNNAAGQVTRIDFADGTHQDFTYSTTGNLLTASDASGTITLTYGNANNPDLVTRISYPDGKFLAFQYNAVGQRTQSVDQTGFTINYQYDSLGRLEKLIDGSGKLIVAYTYDPAGLLVRKDLGNGTATTYKYDLAGDVIKLVNLAADGKTVNSEFDYTYNELGLVTSEETPDGAWAYSYDADGQLTHAVFTSTNAAVPNQDLQYFYDAAGNRTQTIINGVTTAYTTNDMNEYTQVGSTTYGYDADGNLISATTGGAATNYAFNDLNQLTGVTGPGLSASYGYDPLGDRNTQTINGVTTNFLVDSTGSGNVAGEYTGSGSLIAHFTDGLGLTSQVDASGAAAYYDFDANGNTVGLTGQSGSYVNRYSYLPFGETSTLSSALPNPFTYVGQFGVVNDGSGTMLMGLRQYDPSTGQFLSNDPLGLAGGDTNTRRYVGNDPVIYSDPSGLCKQIDDILQALKKQYDLANEALKNTLRKIGDFIDPPPPPFDPDMDRAIQDVGQYIDVQKMRYAREAREQEAEYQVTRQSNHGDPAGQSGGAGGGADCSCDLPPNDPNVPGNDAANKNSNSVGSYDPNELIGPAGYGTSNWVAPLEPLVYTTEFENDPKHATAPAQQVTVSEQLDANLDWTSFQLGNVQFGSNVVNVPAGLQSYQTTVSTTNTDGTPLDVQISAQLNAQTGLVTWTFSSIDPATGLPPTDPLEGFLPVDDSTGRGMGFVTYTVKPKQNDTTGTSIAAQATVVFDTNSPINTNTVSNTIDAGLPTSSVSALPAKETSASFTVSWSGSDDNGGSGIAGYSVFVSDNGGPFTAFQTNTTATSATFAGVNGHTYGFYSVATDNVGNVQPTPTAAQATTTVSATPLNLTEDVYVIGAGTITVSAANGVLANDSGSSQLTVISGTVTSTEGGKFVFHADGSFTYTPPANFPGFDYAKYTAQDTSGDQGTATVNVLSQQGGVVWKFYEQVLHRNPDYAGLQGWIEDFLSGGKPGDIAAGFFESTELLNQIITGYYQQYLGRGPQGNDLPGWEAVWRQTGGPEGIKAGFAASPEFNALAGNSSGTNPAGWLTALYAKILNRAPLPGDLPFWEKQLAGGTSEYQVSLDFFQSLEAYDNDVTGWFYEYLGRAPTTGTGGEQPFFAQQMLAGASDKVIEQAITNSPEYSANPPPSPPGTAERLPDYSPTTNTAKTQASIAATDAVFAKSA